MFYSENGQFKTTYRADQQIFPITQDRVGHRLDTGVCFLGGADAGHRLHVTSPS
jgi:branched-chain amino acid transport system permease protein